MKVLRLILIVSLLLGFSTTGYSAAPIRIATEGAYPPFNYIDKDRNLAGFDVDIAHALCETMNRDCTIKAIPWENLLQRLEDGAIDVIIASMARTPEREKVASFTDYYYRSRTMFVGNPEKSFVLSREGIKDKIIATQSQTVQEAYLKEHFGDVITIKPSGTIGESFQWLVEGKVDAVLTDSLNIYDFLQTKAGKKFDFISSPLPAEDFSSEACIAVDKNNQQLLKDINKALRTLHLNGQFTKINHKYFPFSIY